MKHDIDALVTELPAVSDEEAAGMVGQEAKNDLAGRIMLTDPHDTSEEALVEVPRRSRRRRVLIGAPAAAGLAAAAVLAASFVSTGDSGTASDPPQGGMVRLGPHKVRPAALSFTKKDDYLIIKVDDPTADPKRYREEFAEHGMDIDLTLVPASPSIVGTVVMFSGDSDAMTPITAKGECVTGGGGDACPVGVKIRLGYHGGEHVRISFGRAARPGEKYASTAPATAPGEVLHGLRIRGRTVAEVMPLLGERHVTVPEYRYRGGGKPIVVPTPSPGSTRSPMVTSKNGTPQPGETVGFLSTGSPYPNGVPKSEVQQDWYVSSAIPWAKNQVLLFVGPTKPKPPNG